MDFADSLFCSPFSTLQFLLVAYVKTLEAQTFTLNFSQGHLRCHLQDLQLPDP